MSFTPDQKFQEGQEALRYFYNETIRLFPDSAIAAKNFPAFIVFMQNLPHFKQNSVERLGDAILWAQYPMKRVKEVMVELADAYEGRYPDARGANAMLGALSDDAISISYMGELAAEAIEEGVTDVKNYALGGLGLYALILGGVAVFAVNR